MAIGVSNNKTKGFGQQTREASAIFCPEWQEITFCIKFGIEEVLFLSTQRSSQDVSCLYFSRKPTLLGPCFRRNKKTRRMGEEWRKVLGVSEVY